MSTKYLVILIVSVFFSGTMQKEVEDYLIPTISSLNFHLRKYTEFGKRALVIMDCQWCPVVKTNYPKLTETDGIDIIRFNW